MILKTEYINGVSKNITIVPEKVTRLGFDETWLLAERQVLKTKYEDSLQNAEGRVVNFYIVNMESDEIFGPMNEDDFIHARKRLEVPHKIELKESNNYRSEECSSCI